jgi:large subunit ribosomal protein L13e
MLASPHLRKHWNKWHYIGVKCFFNKKAHKTLRAQKRADKIAAVSPRPINKLRPLVFAMTRKYASKIKHGRGFSLQELKMAGLTGAFAQTVGICVDHRRHNKNAETLAANVKRLNEYKNKLILFPAKEGKVKKGVIPDSTADKVKKATQVVTPSVFDLPPVDKSIQNEPITKEMLATKVYQKLRAERTNARYNGKRILKAKAEAEKNKNK